MIEMGVTAFPIALSSILLGFYNLLSIAVFAKRFGDPGAHSLMVPLVPLLIMDLAEMSRILGNMTALAFYSSDVLQILATMCRLTLGFAWVYVCHTHFRLNNTSDFRQKLTPYFAILTGINLILYLFSVVFTGASFLRSINGAILAFTLYYAAISGYLILRKRNSLLPSSWIALLIAGISVIIHPLVSLADILGFSLPGLEADVPLWKQTLPIYCLLINIPLLVFVWRSLVTNRKPETSKKLDNVNLTERERKIVELLLHGESYKGIGQSLGISLATVKTHVFNSYAKLNVKSRFEMQSTFAHR
jgi:DNA-binding CsgD family transcriptional regulator